MTSKLIGVVLAVGVFVLFIGLAFPTLIGAEESTLAQSAELNTTESVEITDNLRMSLDDVNESEGSANVSLTDTGTLSTVAVTVGETETESTTIEGETVSITLDSIEDADTAILGVEYPSTYGWSDGAKTIASNLDAILMILALLMLAGAALAVVENE